jgi:hypothetical protein
MKFEELLKEEGIAIELFASKIITSAVLDHLRDDDLRKGFTYLMTRISKVINKVIEHGNDFTCIRQGLKEIVSDKYISWDIGEPNPELSEFSRIFSKSKLNGEAALYELVFYSKNEKISSLTVLTKKSYKSKEGVWDVWEKCRPNKYNGMFLDLSFSLAHIFLFNVLQRYIECNKERAEYVLLRTLEAVPMGITCDEYTFDYLHTLNAKFPEVKLYKMYRTGAALFIEENINNFFLHSAEFVGQKKVMANKFTVSFILNLIKDMYQITENISSYIEYMEETERTYAASYELKKNIPQVTLDKMSETSLNNYFKEVEIDELMDLAKIDQVEVEYDKCSHLFFTNRGPSLRFRRLGKYRAAGLFFPFYDAVCVDIHCTDSMIHEVFHWLDYNYFAIVGDTERKSSYKGRLSSSMRFNYIVDEYKNYMSKFISNLSEDDPRYIKWFGNTKYNRKYYCETSEIFARLGEVYYKDTYGSSILCSPLGMGYPEDKDFLALSNAFFTGLFNELNKNEVSKGSKHEDKVMRNLGKTILNYSLTGQLSLF